MNTTEDGRIANREIHQIHEMKTRMNRSKQREQRREIPPPFSPLPPVERSEPLTDSHKKSQEDAKRKFLIVHFCASSWQFPSPFSRLPPVRISAFCFPLSALSSSLSRCLFQRFRVDALKGVRCRLPHARICVVQHFCQRRDRRPGISAVIHDSICRTKPHVMTLIVTERINICWHDQTRVSPKSEENTPSQSRNRSIPISEKLNQIRNCRHGVRSQRQNAPKSLQSQHLSHWSHWWISDHIHKWREGVTAKISQCSNCSDGTLPSVEIPRNSVELRDGGAYLRPQRGEHGNSAAGTDLFSVPKFFGKICLLQHPIHRATHAVFPLRRLVANPFQQIRKRICSNVADGITGFFKQPIRHFEVIGTWRPSTLHPLTQLLPAILGLPLGRGQYDDPANHNGEANQCQINASLSHGRTMMPPLAREASRNTPKPKRTASPRYSRLAIGVTLVAQTASLLYRRLPTGRHTSPRNASTITIHDSRSNKMKLHPTTHSSTTRRTTTAAKRIWARKRTPRWWLRQSTQTRRPSEERTGD